MQWWNAKVKKEMDPMRRAPLRAGTDGADNQLEGRRPDGPMTTSESRSTREQ